MTQSCMGGWCTKRDHCAHYHAATPKHIPAERLCPPGQDGAGLSTFHEEHAMTVEPIPADPAPVDARQVHMPLPERLASILAMLGPQGKGTNEITAALGFKTRSRTSVLLRLLVAEGKVVSTGRGNVNKRFFLTVEDRDKFVEQYRAEMAERRLANCVAASRRYRESKNLAYRAFELPTMRERVQDAKAVKAKRAKAEVVKTKRRLKAETKAAGALVFKTGTDVARPKKLAWAEIPVHNPNNVQPTILPSNLRGRYAVDEVRPVVSSNDCRPWARAAA